MVWVRWSIDAVLELLNSGPRKRPHPPIYSGLAGAIIGIFQIVIYAGVSPELVWIVIGGILNFISGLPIYLSFKKGIFYGVQ